MALPRSAFRVEATGTHAAILAHESILTYFLFDFCMTTLADRHVETHGNPIVPQELACGPLLAAPAHRRWSRPHRITLLSVTVFRPWGPPALVATLRVPRGPSALVASRLVPAPRAAVSSCPWAPRRPLAPLTSRLLRPPLGRPKQSPHREPFPVASLPSPRPLGPWGERRPWPGSQPTHLFPNGP
jgi:hypothetical protein